MNPTCVQIRIPFTLRPFWGLVFYYNQVLELINLGVVPFLLESVPMVHLRLKCPQGPPDQYLWYV